MRRRLPRILWRYTLAELWRLVLLTAAVLVTVIAFAATVKPLADGKLGPLDALRFMALALLPMLQYALPFAAGFGATLAYHRLTTDNEFLAARAAGIGQRSLIVPAAVSGVVLAVALYFLSSQVIPRLVRSMDELIAQDLTRMMVNDIRNGQCVNMNGAMVHADRVVRLQPDPGSGAYDQLLLTGVGAIDFDDDTNEISTEVTAERAWVWLERVGDASDPEGATRVTMKIEHVLPVKQGRFQAMIDEVWLGKVVPGAFDDDPKYLTSGELRDLPSHPDRMNPVDMRRRNLAYALAERQTMESLMGALSAEKRLRLVDPAGRTFVIRAAALERTDDGWDIRPVTRGGPVIVELQRTDERNEAGLTRLAAAAASLRSDVGRSPGRQQVTFTLVLHEAANIEPGDADAPAGERRELSFGDLSPLENPLPDLLKLNSADLLAEADRRNAARPDPMVTEPAEKLRRRIADLGREIISKRHERWAMAAACFVMVLAGAVTAMRLGASLPLTVYLWSFFPALGTVITISAGQQLAHHNIVPGLLMLWGGVGAMCCYAIGAYLVVRRH